ncbi:MAG TPA: AmmeMemoRadiSam system protein B [Blastocatellia bacterium]|nr:AmmeMemoRadiSam system protein B [Blastocatellia bacterium]
MSNIVFCGIAPHPPLLVPEVGGERIAKVNESQRALREFSSRVLATRPAAIVVISPHSPYDPRVFTARYSKRLAGDFRQFGVAKVALSFENDLEMIDALEQAAELEGAAFRAITRDYPLDHGALVPLYYLREAGWDGPVVVIAFTDQSIQTHLAFGRAIRRAADALGRRIAVVASGDLSHRLIEDGPYEFEPTAHLFDEQVVSAIARGDAQAVVDVDPDLRERAGECGYRSILIALGSVDCTLPDKQVLSYEGPFGVGYMVAVLACDPAASRANSP